MIVLPDLPYAYNALEPTVSAETLRFHHDKHHQRYVDVANQAAEGLGIADLSLEDMIVKARAENLLPLLRNAEQVWNHAFFWHSMAAPTGHDAPEAFAALKDEFLAKGAGHFASGWVWIVYADGALKVVDSHDNAGYAATDVFPLIVCDVWEHAYYLDHQNNRAGFLAGFWDKIANWDFARANLERAQKGERWTFAEA
jgi:Fe-Mn family superoxide dismutase